MSLNARSADSVVAKKTTMRRRTAIAPSPKRFSSSYTPQPRRLPLSSTVGDKEKQPREMRLIRDFIEKF
jgi:hypothetical protein